MLYFFVIDNELFFTIDEKNNSTELTDKGIDFLSSLQQTLEEYGIDSYLKEQEHCNRNYPILRITSINNLLQFFKLVPETPKHCNKFESFLEVLTIVSNKHHLTQKGFDRVLEIKGLIKFNENYI